MELLRLFSTNPALSSKEPNINGLVGTLNGLLSKPANQGCRQLVQQVELYLRDFTMFGNHVTQHSYTLIATYIRIHTVFHISMTIITTTLKNTYKHAHAYAVWLYIHVCIHGVYSCLVYECERADTSPAMPNTQLPLPQGMQGSL